MDECARLQELEGSNRPDDGSAVVTAGSAPGMHDLVAEHGAAIVLMHMRGEPRTMQTELGYRHVVAEVHSHLVDRAAAALAAGIPSQRVWLDPGIGFGKDDDGNLALLGALPDLASHGHPVLVGPSNKSFIGRLTGAPVDDRLPGTLGALIAILEVPRAVVRVHDPAAAAALGYTDVVAPPTFAVMIAMKASGVVVQDPELGLDYTRVVHGEQRFEYARPIVAGDELVVSVSIEAIRSMAGNDMVTTRGDVSTVAGEHVVTTTSLLVSRAPEAE